MSLPLQSVPRRHLTCHTQVVDFAGFVAAVNRAIDADRGLDAALSECVRSMIDQLGASAAFVWTVSDDGRYLTLEAGRGASREIAHAYGRLPISSDLPGDIVRTCAPAVADLWSDRAPEETTWARRRGLRNFAAYPLVVDDAVVGVIGLFLWEGVPAALEHAISACGMKIALAIAQREDDTAAYEFVRSMPTHAAP